MDDDDQTPPARDTTPDTTIDERAEGATTLSPGLYIVATPIGNLGDVSQRAIVTLAGCHAVACEDTRVAGRLLHHLGLKRPLLRYDDHASAATRAALLARIATEPVALVSDAGTPLISDPGFRLVREAREAGLAVTSIPGPCALVVALTLAGLPTDRFLFGGFLPNKAKAREDTLRELASVPASLVFYETGPRLIEALGAIGAVLPGREVAVARELTKLHEECRRDSPEALAAHYTAHPPRGEIVLVIAPPGAAAAPDGAALDAELLAELALQPPSQAAATVARRHGLDRKALFARLLELRA